MKMLFDMLWETISVRVESILGTGKAREAVGSASISPEALPDPLGTAAESTCESLPDEMPADNPHVEL